MPTRSTRSRGPLLAIVAVVVVVVVAVSAFVVLGRDDDGGGAALADSTVEVAEVRGLPPLGNFGEASVYTGAFVDDRYLLVGITYDDEGRPVPSVWESDTGERWEEVRSDFENGETAVVSGVQPFDGQVVAVGSVYDPDDLTSSDFAAWYSSDGEDFTEADLPSSPNDQQTLGVIEFEGELLAYGLDGEADPLTGLIRGDFALWRSTDGREWSRAQDVAGIDLPEDIEDGLPFGELAPIGDRLVAVGRTGQGDDSDPAVWISEDGEAWDLTVSSTMAGLDGPQGLNGLAEVDGQIVAVGYDGDDAAVWLSPDAESWERVESPSLTADGDQRMTTVFPVEGGAIAVGNDDPAQDGDRQPAIWISDDLEEWQRLDLGDLATDFSVAETSPYGLIEGNTILLVVDAEDFSGEQVWRLTVDPGAGEPEVLGSDDLDGLDEIDVEETLLVGFDALDEGTCYNLPSTDGDELRYEVVACDQPHDREMIHRFEFEEEGPFPGDEQLFADGDAICQGEVFEEYVGIPWVDSSLFVESLVPTEGSWDFGDRSGACAVYPDGSQADESFAGSGT